MDKDNIKKFLDYNGVSALVKLISAYISEYVSAAFTAHTDEQYHTIKVGNTSHEAKDHIGKIEFAGDGATSVTLSEGDNKISKITISSTDEHVTSVDKHYTPSGGSDKLTGADKTKKTITSLTVDAAGHVTGATLSNIAFPVTSVSKGTSTETYVNLTVNPTEGDVKVSIDDSALQTAINDINNAIAGGISFKGVVTTLPSNPQNGDLIIVGKGGIKVGDKTYKEDYEYVYSNGSWYELGDSDKNAQRITELAADLKTHTDSNHVTTVKQGKGIIVDNNTGDVTISLDLAKSDANGGIKIGYEQHDKNYPVEIDTDGKAFVNVDWENTTAISVTHDEALDEKLDSDCGDANHVHYFVDAITVTDGDTITYTRKGFGCLSSADILKAFQAAFTQQ